MERDPWKRIFDLAPADVPKVEAHAKANGWTFRPARQSDAFVLESPYNQRRLINRTVREFARD